MLYVAENRISGNETIEMSEPGGGERNENNGEEVEVFTTCTSYEQPWEINIVEQQLYPDSSSSSPLFQHEVPS